VPQQQFSKHVYYQFTGFWPEQVEEVTTLFWSLIPLSAENLVAQQPNL
jgi:hypothetical protein